MRIRPSSFTRAHAVILAALWLVGAGLVFTTAYGNAAVRQDDRVLITTAATTLGPMTGAICRNYQRSCLHMSLGLLWYCLPALGAAIAVQFAPLPEQAWARAIRLICWFAGWLVWFAGAVYAVVICLF